MWRWVILVLSRFVRKMGFCSKKRGSVTCSICSLHEIIFQPNLAQLKFMLWVSKHQSTTILRSTPCEILIISPTPFHQLLEVDRPAQKRVKKVILSHSLWHFERSTAIIGASMAKKPTIKAVWKFLYALVMFVQECHATICNNS